MPWVFFRVPCVACLYFAFFGGNDLTESTQTSKVAGQTRPPWHPLFRGAEGAPTLRCLRARPRRTFFANAASSCRGTGIWPCRCGESKPIDPSSLAVGMAFQEVILLPSPSCIRLPGSAASPCRAARAWTIKVGSMSTCQSSSPCGMLRIVLNHTPICEMNICMYKYIYIYASSTSGL